jgi:catechol 2,3-dioxygenase-like lactoylglutathione lyase family enzyme
MTNTTTASLPKTAISGVDILAYLTSDAQRSIAFYRDVLGLLPTEIDDEGRGAEFELADGSTFGVWNPGEPPTSTATVMFAVGDITEAVALYRSRGAELSDPSETPVCHMSFGADPDGNPFIIHQRKPDATHA